MDIQALILPALAALHNFIWEWDPKEIAIYDDGGDDDSDDDDDFEFPSHPQSVGELGIGQVTPAERNRANQRRDRITGDMWEQYQHYLESCEAHN
jgi:hypothetical protein